MFRLAHHAEKQSALKGFTKDDGLAAANEPTLTYDNKRRPGQRRHIRGKVCAVVDPGTGLVVTVYENVTATPLRSDQTGKAARRYASNVK